MIPGLPFSSDRRGAGRIARRPDSRFVLRWAAIALICMGVIGIDDAAAGEWQLAFEERFVFPDWPQRWTLVGSAGPLDKGALCSDGAELAALLKQPFKASAIRVEYEAQMASANASGRVSDLSCMIGGGLNSTVPTCIFQFGADNNLKNRISFPGMPTSTTSRPLIEVGTWHRVAAEVNGRAATLSVDGQRVLGALLPAALSQQNVRLYSWCGNARFRNLRILTKDPADPIPAELDASAQRPLADPPQELQPWREWSVPPVTDVRAAAVARQRVALTVDNPSACAGAWPVTFGFPFPKDVLWDIDAIRITDKAGKEVPSEARLAATWTKGGSIRWVHLDFQPLVTPNQVTQYFVEFGRDVKRTPTAKRVQTGENARTITVENGFLKLVISKERGSLIETAWLDPNGNGDYRDRVIRPEGEKGSYFVTAEGDRYTTTQPDTQYTAVIESSGSGRVVVRTRGWYQNGRGERACYYINRLTVCQGSPEVRLVTTWVNTVDTDKFKFQDLATHFPIALKSGSRATLGTDATFTNTTNSMSGTPPMAAVQAARHEGFIRQGDARTVVKDVGGWAHLSDGNLGLTVAVFDMNKQWPNAIEARADGIVFHGFSNEGGHNLDFSFEFLKQYWGKERYEEFERRRGGYDSFTKRVFNACGLAKTHEVMLRFHGKDTGAAITQFADAAQKMIIAHADPVWTCASNTLGLIHPRDPQRFPQFEASLTDRYNDYLDVLDRLTPIYGFYDYGLGVPHYISARKIANGDTEYVYAGYRREYDIGYGKPVVPWMLFMRSGESRYYRQAIAYGRHCMDAHCHHWTNPRLHKRIGWCIADHGSWVYDSNFANFTFNNWMEYMLLSYYVRGDQRSMDVAVQIIDAANQESTAHGPFGYNAAVGLWHGNIALMYRALWEESLGKLYRMYERKQLDAWCAECGGFGHDDDKHKVEPHGATHRQLFREYGLYQGSLVPDHSADLDVAFAALGQTDFRTLGWGPRHILDGSSYSHWAAYQKTKDPRFIKYAQLQVECDAPSLTGFDGLGLLRNRFAWMSLAVLPGAENVQVSLKAVSPRTEVNPLFLQHTQGKATALTATRALRCMDAKGTDVTDKTVRNNDILQEYVLSIPPQMASGVYRVAGVVPATPNPWAPFTPLAFTYSPDLKFMLGMADGIAAERIWLYIPAGTRGVQVCTPKSNKITLTLPDGTTMAGTGPVWNATLAPSVQSQLILLEQEATRDAFFKVFGAPAYATLAKEAAFEVAGDLAAVMDPSPSDLATAFVKGVFANSATDQALQFNGKRSLEIPLGEQKAAGRRAHFDVNQGTVEFFVKLNSNPDLNASGLPIRVNLDKSVPVAVVTGGRSSFLSWNEKGSIRLSDGKQHEVLGYVTLCAGRWYHFAVTWKLDEGGKLLRKCYLNGRPYQHDRAAVNSMQFWPPAWQPVLPGPTMEIGASVTRQFDFALDELRISDSLRYVFNKEFVPPAAPFSADRNTLLLFHFDGNTTGLTGDGASRVEATFKDKP